MTQPLAVIWSLAFATFLSLPATFGLDEKDKYQYLCLCNFGCSNSHFRFYSVFWAAWWLRRAVRWLRWTPGGRGGRCHHRGGSGSRQAAAEMVVVAGKFFEHF